ncbi:ECF-type sigma factor (plasmid) [Streptomyces anulatus]|uniref:RNA polymerase sigma factor n=1 Tax=Streptomyces anulatus TaxID=1892 RepID=UPI002DD82B1C|nr:sigma factor-like helix-turn-helix DNA-binding protein [Streptomyces anulatus]WSC66923.1 ECF-type sigma factor [Streptomyces anulatus]
MKKKRLIPGQRDSILPLLFPEEELPSTARSQWGYVRSNEPAFRRYVLVRVGEMHEGDVSDKAFQGLHTRLKSGPVEEIKKYAGKAFGNAVRKFHVLLAKERAKELLIGDDDWVLEEAPMPVPGYSVEFDLDSVAASVEEQMQLDHYRETLAAELSPGELIAISLVAFDGYTAAEAAKLLGLTSGAVRNALSRARAKANPLRGRLGLA